MTHRSQERIPTPVSIFSSCLLLLLIFHIPTRAVDPLYHVCDNTVNYSNTSQFSTNLKQLFSSLSSTGEIFYSNSVGDDPNKVYGLTLCRGDATSNTCKNCINNASDEILSQCPNRSATIWYDVCLLRYSNTNFLGSSSTPVWIYMWNTQNATNPVQFERVLGELMNNLSTKAAFDEARMYATGVSEVSSFSSVYGLAQCIRDISPNDCKRCLEAATGQIPNCCDKKQGGRVFGPVCTIRFESYLFYGPSAIADPSHSATSPATAANSPPPPPGPTDAIVPPPSPAPPPDSIGLPPKETSTGTEVLKANPHPIGAIGSLQFTPELPASNGSNEDTLHFTKSLVSGYHTGKGKGKGKGKRERERERED
ncbi:cysteine-rich repeat secretory protein 38-like protein [Cinnamomum micranthum f. kanehirae]|uniref:Cysteine-rich repeat secretory protein 38-like protein n=1 Tax=Cinnamomum micranthum f. kanehirae TaxID=337451 RepID=A0A3S4PIB7_9MAGN|nr:cysteine-rich repeat secretory protein 38-like protein [Cinnamomum micranthum f. kanehirae]